MRRAWKKRSARKSFHVLVEWPDPDAQPWLVLVKAESPESARAEVETNDEIRAAGGRVVQIDDVLRGAGS